MNQPEDICESCGDVLDEHAENGYCFTCLMNSFIAGNYPKTNIMKKIILILALTFTLFSCTDRQEVVIDGCQYIETTSFNGDGGVTSLTHKGNCNNPIHLIKDTTNVRRP